MLVWPYATCIFSHSVESRTMNIAYVEHIYQNVWTANLELVPISPRPIIPAPAHRSFKTYN